MFLALKEMLHEKARYSLIVLIITLITLMSFFLSSLSDGLATSNKTALMEVNDAYKAVEVSDSANDNLLGSFIEKQDLKKNDKTLSIANEVGYIDNKKVNLTFFGTNSSKILPKLTEGRKPSKDDEVAISQTIKNEAKIKLNDEIRVAGNNHILKVVGFTKPAQYQTLDVAYVNNATIAQINPQFNNSVSAILTNHKVKKDGLEYITIPKVIESLPGYRPQNMTFGMMIVSLVLIAAAIIAIFTYILTIQKTNIFAVLKARGFSSKFISRSIVAQTFVVSLIATTLGLVITILMSFVLPKTMFFKVDYVKMAILFVLFIIASLIGAFLSTRKIKKINPMDALR